MAIPVKDVLLAPYAANWQTRLPAGYATFGLTSADATAFTAVYEPYMDAWNALLAARNSGIFSKDLTANKNAAKGQLLLKMRELYSFVQSSLEVSDGNKELLGVKVVSSARAPTAPPGPLSNFSAGINADGSLTIKWKSDNPVNASGTIYQVWRRIDLGEFVYLGGTGAKMFTDYTIPVGASNLTYKLQAVRSTAIGPWATFNVTFGMGVGAGANGVKITETPAAKLAA
jgi:hypothetical protein